MFFKTATLQAYALEDIRILSKTTPTQACVFKHAEDFFQGKSYTRKPLPSMMLKKFCKTASLQACTSRLDDSYSSFVSSKILLVSFTRASDRTTTWTTVGTLTSYLFSSAIDSHNLN